MNLKRGITVDSKRIGLFLFSLLLSCLVFAQATEALLQKTNPDALRLQSYAVNVAQFNRHNPQEKVYLHMDNRSYFIGDTIFFKSYVMNATTHYRTRISEVLYVELLNESGIEVEHLKLKIEGGICHGSFILKDNYRSGYYEIRSYTRHMLNFGNEKMPWINIQKYIKEDKLNPYAALPEKRARSQSNGEQELFSVYPTPIWEQSIVADANYCQFSRVFPVYMRPEKKGIYKREMDWYPKHAALAMPAETEEEMRDDSLRIAFYPEGGALVAGVPSRIAVDVSDQWGREKEVDGCIVDGYLGRDTVAVFRSGHRGRGVFTFCPGRGKNYYARINYKGRTYRYALPDVEDKGYVLRVNAPITGDSASFTVNASGTGEELVGWTLQCRGALVMFDTIRIAGGVEHAVTIPSFKLNEGVNQLTLFNARGEVLAERLFFVCPSRKQPSFHLTRPLPESLSKFEKVTIELCSKTANGDPAWTHFSISVTDTGENGATFDTGDLRSEMLLSSELKGFIKDVDSYFRHSNDTVMRDDLDLLMMVQGWRRYEWQTMAGIVPYTPRYAPEYGLQLDGYVISNAAPEDKFADASTYKILGNLNMHVAMKDPLITVSDTFEVDSLGRFRIDFGKDFFGEIPMTLTLCERNGKVKRDGVYSRLKFAYPVIHRAFSPATTPYDYYQDHTPEDDELRTAMNNYDWQKQGNIKTVEVTKKRKSSWEINYDQPDIVVDYYKEWNNTIDRGIPNANIYDHKQYYSNERERSEKEAFLYGEEEEPLSPDNENNEIRLNYTMGRSRLWGRIARAEDSTFTYAAANKNRYRVYLMPKTINVYSNLVSREPYSTAIDPATDTRAYVVWKPQYYRRSLSPRTAPYMLKDGIRNTYYEGYSRVVSYYHRNYEEEKPPKHDYRRTLYWEPNVTTSVLGRTQITFFNNSRAERIHIRAEGITRNGEFIVYDSDKVNQ